MQKIENLMQQPLVITCSNGRVIHLLAAGRAALSDEEMKTAHVQSLIEKKCIHVSEEKKSVSRATKKTPHHK